jgi:hypothetical protein
LEKTLTKGVSMALKDKAIIIIDKDDINNPVHPNLFKEWLEELGLPENTETITLYVRTAEGEF